jgi:hypothetical protein
MDEPPFSEGVKERASKGGASRKLVGVGKLEQIAFVVTSSLKWLKERRASSSGSV